MSNESPIDYSSVKPWSILLLKYNVSDLPRISQELRSLRSEERDTIKSRIIHAEYHDGILIMTLGPGFHPFMQRGSDECYGDLLSVLASLYGGPTPNRPEWYVFQIRGEVPESRKVQTSAAGFVPFNRTPWGAAMMELEEEVCGSIETENLKELLQIDHCYPVERVGGLMKAVMTPTKILSIEEFTLRDGTPNPCISLAYWTLSEYLSSIPIATDINDFIQPTRQDTGEVERLLRVPFGELEDCVAEITEYQRFYGPCAHSIRTLIGSF